MARSYTEDLSDLPAVAVTDWELLERLESLVEPWVPVMNNGAIPIFHATDRRGSYDASSIEELRQEASMQESAPDSVRLTVQSFYPDLYVDVYVSKLNGSGGRIDSSDEVFVNHTSARIRDLFAAAVERNSKSRPGAELVPFQRVLLPSRKAREVLYNPWITTIVGGTVVTIVGILLTLWPR